MGKIKIKDLTGNGKVSKKDLKKVKGGLAAPQILKTGKINVTQADGSIGAATVGSIGAAVVDRITSR